MSKRSYPFLSFDSGVDWKDVNPKILTKLNNLGRAIGKTVTITSGYRSVAKQQYLWNHASELGLVHYKTVAYPGKSEHQYGQAVDATIGSTPLGEAVSPVTLAKYDLKCSVPNDRVHTDLLSNTKYSTTGSNDTYSGSTGGTTTDTGTTQAQPKPATVVDATATLPQNSFVSPSAPTAPGPATVGTLGSNTDMTFFQPNRLAETWTQLAAQENSSPDTQLYAQRLG